MRNRLGMKNKPLNGAFIYDINIIINKPSIKNNILIITLLPFPLKNPDNNDNMLDTITLYKIILIINL